MLDLQRASAGSGKTYTLARQFIQYMIGQRPGGSDRWLLRNPADIIGGLRAILAVTFTNKATNEMQMRIIDKLDALARYKETDAKKPDYMEYFEDLFEEGSMKISKASEVALKTLLDNYSDFNVSTIDAFFQTVLRTLAYESGYSDNYQIELEGDYVSRVGLNATLDDVDSNRTDPDAVAARLWVKEIIDNEEGHRWNIFQMSEPSGPNSKSPYKNLLDDFRRIDNEDYRRQRDAVEKYLSDPGTDLLAIYRELDKRYNGKIRDLYDAMQARAETVARLCADPSLRQGGNKTISKPYNGVGKVMNYTWNKVPKAMPAQLDKDKIIKSLLKSKVIEGESGICEWEERLDAYNKMYDACEMWVNAAKDPEFRLWQSLKVSFPFLGLLKAVTDKREEYLSENNAVELGETSLILNRIIAPSDTPFVYERMGTRLHHFLIDEFQDTSLLQWLNLKPLLEQSLSTDNDNLIIGDAKQSIYRFRNAEPRLINETVEKELGSDAVNLKGMSAEENTNHRSDRRIVEWNNDFFHFVVESLGQYSETGRSGPGGSNPFADVYSNVRQEVPVKKKDSGFVRIYLESNATGRKRKKNEDDGELGDEEPVETFSENDTILSIIEDALRRGYSQKDIAVLVRNNVTGMGIVDLFRSYNLKHAGEEGSTVLEFVSEQSLIIGKSPAVQQIETILNSIASGMLPDKSDDRHRPAWNIYKLICNILLYSQLHPDRSKPQCMEEFLNENPDLRQIDVMLSEMQTTALPALVEAIIATFISDDMRKHDAVFLAAFQDCVLEYCEGHPSDLPSFLDWWNRARTSKSISSPEDVDAIRIMTIHKAKGLEFPVVIIPQFDGRNVRLGDNVNDKEWKWVDRSMLDFKDPDINAVLPPLMPVKIDDKLEGTCLDSVLHEYYYLQTMDVLNVGYVAMTRAVNELYVIAKVVEGSNAKAKGWGMLLQEFAESGKEEICIEKTGGKLEIVEYGVQPVCKQMKEHDKEDVEKGDITELLTEYHATYTPDCIKCREESVPGYVDAEEYDEESEDARSVGNICHAIMERVKVSGDIDREIKRAGVLGLVDGREVYLETLRKAVSDSEDERVRKWFGGGAEKIFTERPLLRRRNSLRRPDRIMVWPARDKSKTLPDADIIDYKFGKRNISKHKSQVKNYVDKLKATGKYSQVRGWLWYVFDNDIDNGVVYISD